MSAMFKLDEFYKLSSKKQEPTVPDFLLLTGGRGRINQEAVEQTIKIFNSITKEKFVVFITGPWKDYMKFVNNTNIKILGVVPQEKLKNYSPYPTTVSPPSSATLQAPS